MSVTLLMRRRGAILYPVLYTSGGVNRIYKLIPSTATETSITTASYDYRFLAKKGNFLYAGQYNEYIYKIDISTGARTQLTTDMARNWISGVIVGDTLYACNSVSGTAHIYAIDINTGEVTQITSTARTRRGLAYSNGFLYNGVEGQRIYKIDLATFTETIFSPVSRVWRGLAIIGNNLYGFVNNAYCYAISLLTAAETELLVSARNWQNATNCLNRLFVDVYLGYVYEINILTAAETAVSPGTRSYYGVCCGLS